MLIIYFKNKQIETFARSQKKLHKNEIMEHRKSSELGIKIAWKNLQQTTLVDAMLIEHEALKELDDVHELINWSRIESLLAGLHSTRRGEKAWPPFTDV